MAEWTPWRDSAWFKKELNRSAMEMESRRIIAILICSNIWSRKTIDVCETSANTVFYQISLITNGHHQVTDILLRWYRLSLSRSGLIARCQRNKEESYVTRMWMRQSKEILFRKLVPFLRIEKRIGTAFFDPAVLLERTVIVIRMMNSTQNQMEIHFRM